MTAIFTVDAFTDTPFRGNPAGVCLLETERDADYLQSVAAEMALSETAFLLRRGATIELRWFTPASEIELCGHATLASAHVLWNEAPGWLGRADGPLEFSTASGPLTARRREEMIVLDFPGVPAEATDPPAVLWTALDLAPAPTLASRFDLVVVLDDEAAVRGCRPDLAQLSTIAVRGVAVTAPAEPGHGADFVSRFFAPAVGVPEDPVTGSLHCTLAPYWAARLGRDTLTGFQVSPRGGRVEVRVVGDRVELAGRAVTVLAGTLR